MAKRRAGSPAAKKRRAKQAVKRPASPRPKRPARGVSQTAKKPAKQAAKRPPARAKRPARSVADQSRWPYSQYAVWSQCWGSLNDDKQTRPTTALLRHPTTPFMGTGNLDDFEHDLQAVAYAYLATANDNPLIEPRLEIPAAWLNALDPDGADVSVFPPFGWLRLRWPTRRHRPVSSLVSFRALRRNAPAHTQSSKFPADQIVILIASQKTGFDDKALALGSQFGIRVVAHVKQSSKSQFEIRITGMSASLPFGIFRTSLLPRSLVRTSEARALDAAAFFQSSIEFLTSPEGQFRDTIAQNHGLETGSVAIQGVRLTPILTSAQGFQAYAQVRVSAVSKKTNTGAATSVDLRPYYSFTFATKLTTNDANEISSGELSLVGKAELLAEAQAFPIDPASQKDATEPLHKRRPTRREDVLAAYRVPEPTPTVLDYAPDGYDDDMVVMCPGFVFADNNAAPGTVKIVPPGDAPVRSNDASAIMAYWNVEQFFDRMRAYGIDPLDYFRIAPLPLEVHYRSGILPGPGKDGQTVNAQIRVKGFPDNFEGPIPAGDAPTIEMHLALADLSTRARKPWDGANRSPAEPLGIAADARWVWHEIGHVLLTTSVGELQFRFAHSPGDALAAIVSDPESMLATDPNWRGSTFPWVFLPRRHDRCVLQGWSWSGGLHYALSQVEDVVGPRRKAYWSEQILSSSLFRLYRSIGGDTMMAGSNDPDPHARRSASHYCVYLIMRGIQILGASLVSPTNDPDQLVSALIDADLNTASSTPSWQVVFPPVFPQGAPDTFTRIGGCLPKVIRWAFEAQGLYRSFTNAPGYPPPVDIFVADLRPPSEPTPCGDIVYGPGSYNPVSLEWNPNQGPQDPPPQWQADPAAIIVSPNTGEISVVVGNRGTAAATNVEVSVWWQEWPVQSPAPQWDPTTWAQCALMGPGAPQTIPPSGGQATFGPFAAVPLPAGTRYLLIAQATCPDDRANVDPATNSPCSQKPTPLIDLVANDNNLGLRVLQS
jgi:hypothetical protein